MIILLPPIETSGSLRAFDKKKLSLPRSSVYFTLVTGCIRVKAGKIKFELCLYLYSDSEKINDVNDTNYGDRNLTIEI
jgi:hypothetical protein